jgi:hypothetical protein
VKSSVSMKEQLKTITAITALYAWPTQSVNQHIRQMESIQSPRTEDGRRTQSTNLSSRISPIPPAKHRSRLLSRANAVALECGVSNAPGD